MDRSNRIALDRKVTMMNTRKRSMKKALIILGAIIIVLYLVFIVVLQVYSNKFGFDISGIEPEVEYMNIHETGGISGVNNNMTVYKDDPGYYIQYNEKDRIGITKTEYLLSTDIDIDYLKDAPESWASDCFYHELTFRRSGEEVTIPSKAYVNKPFELCDFIYDNKDKPWVGRVTYDTFINLASYMYLKDQKFYCLHYRTRAENGDLFFKGILSCKENVNDWGIYREATGIYETICNNSVKPSRVEQKEKMINECKKIDYYGGTAYYKQLSNDDLYGFVIVCPENKDFILFLSEKKLFLSDKNFNGEIMSILTGTSVKPLLYIFGVGTAVFIILLTVSSIIVIQKYKITNVEANIDKTNEM